MAKRISRIWIPLLLFLTLTAGIVVVRMVRTRLVQAASSTAGVFWTCTPNIVVSANVRVVAHCTNGYVIDPSTTIYWFAYPTKDSGNSSRMLSLFETAKATNSTITVYFDTSDLSGAAYGCQTNDCRAIWAATTP